MSQFKIFVKNLVAVWIACLLLSPALAQGRATTTAPHYKAKMVNKLVTLTGVESLLGQLPGIAGLSINEATSKYPATQQQYLKAWGSELLQNYDQSKYREQLVQDWTEQINIRDIQAILQWYETPLGQKVSRLEMEANKAENISEMQEYLTSLSSNPPPPERVAAIQTLATRSQAAEMTFGLVEAMLRGVYTSTFGATLEEQQIEKLVTDSTTAAKKQLAPVIFGSMLFTYRELSNTEIAQYAELYQTPAGSRMNQSIYNSLQYTLQDWFASAPMLRTANDDSN